MRNRLFIISNRLPLNVEKNETGYQLRPSSGGLISAISSYLNSNEQSGFTEHIWAGFPDCDKDSWEKASSEPFLKTDYNFLPVFIEKDAYQAYYNGFSNSLLWPLFHYFPSFAEYNDHNFETYMQVNELFAETLAKQLQKNDVVWIHDYHLLPLAGLLRKRFPTLTIGFFLHIPFPSYELFRIIPKYWQQALLTGMAGADLIGFHTSDYAAHFLDCMENMLKIEHDGQYFLFENRKVKADAFPISIDFNLFNSAADNQQVATIRESYEDLKQDKKLIFSVDRMDYTKGLYNRLKAYHKFLLDNPSYIGKVIFVLVVVPSRDEVSKYAEKKKIIDEYIGNLNSSLGDIGWQPVLYHYNHLAFEELIALYTTCDLALITPLRDGMNLVAKEFVASRKDKKGVLVLSEMAGAARELTEALLINPNDITEIAEAIKSGLEMPEEQQIRKMETMQTGIRRYNVNVWAADFFENLISVKAQQLELAVKFIDGFTRSRLLDSYARSVKRLLLLDYDGTLVPFNRDPLLAIPGEKLLASIEALVAEPENTVYIVSGRESQILDKWFGHLPIGLIAEHGAMARAPGADWTVENIPEKEDWQNKIETLMNTYSLKCAGSFIERKEFSVAWHYRNAEIAEGYRRAKELYAALLKATALSGLEVMNGHKVVEVRKKGINKGLAVGRLVDAQEYDYILCLGDDRTDEDMFVKLAERPDAFTIKVGTEASFAKYNLQTAYLVQSLLQTIIEYPKKNILLN